MEECKICHQSPCDYNLQGINICSACYDQYFYPTIKGYEDLIKQLKKDQYDRIRKIYSENNLEFTSVQLDRLKKELLI